MGNFRHLPLNAIGLEKMERIQVLFEELDHELSYVLTPGREASLVSTQLELACFWAKKGMSLQKENQVGGDLRHHSGPQTRVDAAVDKLGEDLVKDLERNPVVKPPVMIGLSQTIGTSNNSSGQPRPCICHAAEDVQGWHTPKCDDNERVRREAAERTEYGPNHQ